MRVVPDSIQAAPTGRAKCRGCGKPIAKGELRFGEVGPNAYGEGESTSWFHVTCGALMRSERFLPTLRESGTVLSEPERAWLEQAAERGIAHPRLQRLTRAERASSGRATCRSCRELIAKGDWRFVLQMFEEGRPTPIGMIHAACAEAYFDTADVLGRAQRLTPELGPADFAELEKALAQQRPGLAKTQGSDSEDPSATGTSSG